MQEMENSTRSTELTGTEANLAESVVESLAHLGADGENLAEVAHDARNMVTALGLYCDLLEEPGVLSAPFQHYGSELKLVAAASRRLVEKLMALEPAAPAGAKPANDTTLLGKDAAWAETGKPQTTKYWESVPATPVKDLAWELQANRNLLAALAGPAINLTVDVLSGALPVRLTSEDLTRILVNLVKNAVEAMPTGGRIHLSLRESPTGPGEDPWLTLNIEDNGPGISSEPLEKIFDPGYSTRSKAASGNPDARSDHRGLGLSIVRSIVEKAGGQIHAANRDPLGACIQIELPAQTW